MMNTPAKKSNRRKYSFTEILIATAMIVAICGFAVLSLVRNNHAALRTTTTVELANQLQKARLDSMKRNAKEPNQMAQLRIFNRNFYSLAIDGDGDGNLDVPVVRKLPEESGVEIAGPFPKTYIFDWQGRFVDDQNQPAAPLPITVSDGSGASTVKFEDGNITVVRTTT